MFHALWHHLILRWLGFACIALAIVPAHAQSRASESERESRCEADTCPWKKKTYEDVVTPVVVTPGTPAPAPLVEESDNSAALIVAAVVAGALLGLHRIRHYV